MKPFTMRPRPRLAGSHGLLSVVAPRGRSRSTGDGLYRGDTLRTPGAQVPEGRADADERLEAWAGADAPEAARGPGTDPGSDRAALRIMLVAVWLLPLLNPKGPFNTAPVDFVMALAILTVILWAGTTRARLHMPYVVPATGLALAGLVAALLSTAPRVGGIAVTQEIFLLVWCAVIVSICRTPFALQSVLRAWCLSATAWGAFLVAAVLSGHDRLAGVGGSDGGRARLLFDHPNMAGNYFMIAIFVVLATRYPRRPLARAGVYAVLILATILCGSNTALLSLPVGGLVIIFLAIRNGADTVKAAAVVLCLVVAGGAVWSVAAEPVRSTIAQTENPLLRYSVARSSRSAAARQSLFASQYELFKERSLFGLGPAGTRQALDDAPVATVKEAHNDYLATLVERGPLGVLALLVLIGSIVARLATVHRLSPPFASVVPNPAAITAALVAFAVTGVTHEVLHYRHLWTLLAVLGALHLFGRRSTDPFSAAPVAPDISVPVPAHEV